MTRQKVNRVILFALAVLISCIFIFPIVWIILSSFKEGNEIFAWPIMQGLLSGGISWFILKTAGL